MILSYAILPLEWLLEEKVKAYEHMPADLRAFHRHIIDRGLPIKIVLNHGVSLSFYFADPEGHMIEIYWPTGIACIPRHGEPIDLTRSEEELGEVAIGDSS